MRERRGLKQCPVCDSAELREEGLDGLLARSSGLRLEFDMMVAMGTR